MSTKGSMNSTQKSASVTSTKQSKTPMEKLTPSINITNVKQSTSNRKSLSNIKSKLVPKNTKAMKKKNCANLLNTNAKLKESKNENKPVPNTFLGLFEDINVADYDELNDFDIMVSPGKFNSVMHTDNSRSETPPLFGNQWSVIAKSLVTSEPPSPLSKSVEAKALKRIKAPKLSVEEEIKNNKKKNNKKTVNYKAVANKINKMLEFGEQYNEDE